MKERFWLVFTGISGFTAVALGAAGTHLLQSGYETALTEKAAMFQLVHTVAILALARSSGRGWGLARLLFLAGILLFSGGIYLRAFGFLSHAPFAPLGGFCFMAGWVMVALAGLGGRR